MEDYKISESAGYLYTDVSASKSFDRHQSRRRLRPLNSKVPPSSKRKITDEEIAEYLAKKALKVAEKLKSQTVAGYSNDSNPFGDSNLDGKFVWRKKIVRDLSQGVPLDQFSLKAEKKRRRERMAEIEKVKKRRKEREIEKAGREEEMTKLARERARAEFEDWEKKEEEFDFDQSKVRSEIRLREGRFKPIDILTKYLDPSGDFEIEINEPYEVFNGLTLKQMEELHSDIKMHFDLDKATVTRIKYWDALLVVCEWELAEARKKDALEGMVGEERGLHASIEADVESLLQGKTYVELEALQTEIESQMRSGAAKVVEYWEAVLKRLGIYKAKACLKENHTRMQMQHLVTPTEFERAEEFDQDVHNEDEVAGSFSPQLLHVDEDEETIDPEEDKAILERERMAVKRDQELSSRLVPPMEEGDVVFGSNDEINLDSQVVYWWHDKYRPRKPKYLNRVHTGYEWNKYNQTHYDHDNPPAKMVQGYKFNIFYPDLVDRAKAPTYTIEKDGDSVETCIVRFHAGPPYEDIAFRIVNKEWEYSHKKGFKCTFERGILHLYFNFIRYRYRR